MNKIDLYMKWCNIKYYFWYHMGWIAPLIMLLFIFLLIHYVIHSIVDYISINGLKSIFEYIWYGSNYK